MTAARFQLDDAAFAVAWAEGEDMAQEAAIDYALGAAEPSPAPSREEAPTGEPQHGLTRREEQVALLVARGLTDRQIASELAISERTVTTHVGRTLKKLKLGSRAQLATWITEQRLRP